MYSKLRANLSIPQNSTGTEAAMPPKMGRKRKQIWNNLNEDLFNSESTTHLNNKSDASWKCTVSAKRNLISNSAAISNRRRSLRSSTRLIETEKTSLSNCSQPQISRKQPYASSGSDDIHLLDPHPANTINSTCQAPEGSIQVESPLNYITQDVHLLTLELVPKNVETCEAENADVEMSVSNDSNQMVGQNTFEAESIVPLEKEPLEAEAEEIQASTKNQKKCISRVGCSSPSFSLKLTEMIGMMEDENEDEVDSWTESKANDTVNGYRVKPEFMPILRKIIDRYGDIASNCSTSSVKIRTTFLEEICEIVSELETKYVNNIKEKEVKNKIGLVGEIKCMGVQVEWLRMKLMEILEARQILKQFDMLKEQKESNRKKIEAAERALVECETEKREIVAKETLCKDTLDSAKHESEEISHTIKWAISKVKPFFNRSLINDLI